VLNSQWNDGYRADSGPSKGVSCRRAFRPIEAFKDAVCYVRLTCAPCKGGTFQWVQVPPGQTLQPEATGAVMEVTKWLKPSV
jgi:hypothetical protein